MVEVWVGVHSLVVSLGVKGAGKQWSGLEPGRAVARMGAGMAVVELWQGTGSLLAGPSDFSFIV